MTDLERKIAMQGVEFALEEYGPASDADAERVRLAVLIALQCAYDLGKRDAEAKT